MVAEEDLVLHAKAGEEAAFTELVGRYYRPVLNFVYRLCGNRDDADELAQDVFVRVYRHIGTFEPRSGAKFTTWLFQVARNVVFDYGRRRSRRPESVMPAEDVAAQAKAASVATPRDAMENRETGAAVAAAVAELPEDQRVAIVLAEYHGMSGSEIADVMECPLKTVENRLYRARTTLRERLASVMG